MPTARIPLVGSFNQRTIDGERVLDASQDQRFLNCSFNVVQNPITQKATIYVEKRPGWKVDAIVAANNISTGLIKTDSLSQIISAFGDTNSTIYDGQVSVGTITGRALYFSETFISGTGFVLIKSSDGTGWYYADDAKDQTAYVGDVHNGTAVIDSLDTTVGMYVGQAISGTDIAAGARILTVDSASQITLNANSTGDGTDTAITKVPVAKILDADFVTSGTSVTAFVEMDGYLFYGNSDGKVYNSDLNSITAHTSTGFISAQMAPDPPNALARHKNMVLCFGHSSMEAFYNAGNATGSPLARAPQFFTRHGALDQKSVAVLVDDIYFVTSAKYGDVQVVRLRNLSPQVVSTPNVSRILGTFASSGGAVYLSAWQLGGYNHISTVTTTQVESGSMLLMETGEKLLLETGDDILLEEDPNSVGSFGRMLVSNVDLGVWSEWDCQLATFVVGIGSGATSQLIATSRVDDDGKVYRIKPSSDGAVYTDDGSAYTMEVRTSKIDHGTENRKFVKSIRLVADEQSTGTVTLEASDDDYANWVSLGTFDLTQKDKRIYGCGSYTGGRAYRLQHTAAAPCRAEALEIEYEAATV